MRRRGYRVTEEGLAQLIQTQEKLADIFGRKRRTVSIGIYQLSKIQFPVTYDLVSPDEGRFTPLGMETVMTLSEMLMVHPKGLEHGAILRGHGQVPCFAMPRSQALSFPPIINSREVGEVQVGDEELFIEVTGTDLPMVVLTLNIFASNLGRSGGGYRTDRSPISHIRRLLGKGVVTPQESWEATNDPVRTIEQALGQALAPERGQRSAGGLRVWRRDEKEKCDGDACRPYRQDLMHPIDVVEDVAISRGYQTVLSR